jgi:hypothetical protein
MQGMSGVQDIGDTAGKVWNFLHERGQSKLSAVEQGVRAPKSLVYMAVGWLAREGKLEVRQERRTVQVSLTEN